MKDQIVSQAKAMEALNRLIWKKNAAIDNLNQQVKKRRCYEFEKILFWQKIEVFLCKQLLVFAKICL
jgi:Trm5-related predicted tRNA methylase